MNITGFKVKPTSTTGFSLLESNEKRGVCPEISIQLPTDVANEIVRRWNSVEKSELKVNDVVVFDGRLATVTAVSQDKTLCYLEQHMTKFLWKDVPVGDCRKA